MDLDSGNRIVMANAKFNKAKRSQKILGLLDLFKALFANLKAISKPGGKAG